MGIVCCSAMLCLLGVAAAPRWGGFYTAERVAAIRANVERFKWLRARRDGHVRAAERWLNTSDEQLWAMVPGQDLPRCIDVTMTRDSKTRTQRRAGCLVCGDKIFRYGNYPYRVDIWGHPWKIQCPSCKHWFPTNDFAKFYESALDEAGLFHRERGDRSLLFNAEHPDPADPKHKWGVDDGFGYRAPNGQEYRFIAYYAWRLWNEIERGMLHLALAYLYTGDRRYAHKAAVLLDRVADVYPDMDWAPYAKMGWFHSDGGSGKGKIQGCIWECSDLRIFAQVYDIIKPALDDPGLYTFLAEQARRYKLPSPKGSIDLFERNVEDRILRCGAEAVIAGRIRGNEGMHQNALAWAAVALDREPDTSRYLDWIFAADGGHVPRVILQQMDRDGVGEEGGPGYALSWGVNLGHLANLLAAYRKYQRQDIYRDFPRFRNAFLAGVRMTVLDYTTPPIGDSSATGAIGKAGPSAQQILAAYRACGDPRLAVAAWIRAGRNPAAMYIDEIDADPQQWSKKVRQAVEQLGEDTLLGPDHMRGYGLVSLEVGRREHGTAAWMYYGQNYGHGHRDRLNFGIYSYGLDLAPDLGYPEFATSWPKRNEWTTTTIAHNTVVVDERPQEHSRIGRATLFKILPRSGLPRRHRPVSEASVPYLLQAAEVSSPEVYKQVSQYRRLLVLVPLSESEGYVVDIFRVVGGKDHVYSFHGPPGAPTTEGLSLVPQGRGTYAGLDVPFGPARGKCPLGFSWLYDVRRQERPPGAWTVDFPAAKGYRNSDGSVHLTMHFCGELAEVALASGDPPQNKAGNPRRLPYVLARRRGRELSSCFVAVFDPWRESRHVKSVERVPVSGRNSRMAVALRIELADGGTDWLLSAPEAKARYVADNGPGWTGRLAFVRQRAGRILAMALVDGSSVSWAGKSMTMERPGERGVVAKFDKDMEGNARLWLSGNLSADVAGEEIYLIGADGRNPAYRIHGLRADGGLTCVDCGPTDFIEGLADPRDYAAGYVYLVAEGQIAYVPNHAVAVAGPGGLELVEATGPARVR